MLILRQKKKKENYDHIATLIFFSHTYLLGGLHFILCIPGLFWGTHTRGIYHFYIEQNRVLILLYLFIYFYYSFFQDIPFHITSFWRFEWEPARVKKDKMLFNNIVIHAYNTLLLFSRYLNIFYSSFMWRFDLFTIEGKESVSP